MSEQVSDKVEGTDFVQLVVLLRNVPPVLSFPMSRQQASEYVRGWWTSRMITFQSDRASLREGSTPEQIQKERDDHSDWIRNGTIALNLLRKDGTGDYAQAAWAVSEVVGMYVREVEVS